MTLENRWLAIIKASGLYATDFEIRTGTQNSPFKANTHFIDAMTENLKTDLTKIRTKVFTQRPMRDGVEGAIKGSGDIEVAAYPIHSSSMLYYGLGNYVTGGAIGTFGSATLKENDNISADWTETKVAGTNMLYRHDITPVGTSGSQSGLPHFTAEVTKDLSVHTYYGVAITNSTIEIGNGNELVTFKFDSIFRKEKTSSTGEVSKISDITTVANKPMIPSTYRDVDNAFSPVNFIVCLAETPTSLTYSPYSFNRSTNQVNYLENISISINNNIAADDSDHSVGSRYLNRLYVQGLEVNGSIDFSYDSSDRYSDYLKEGTKHLQIEGLKGRDDTNYSSASTGANTRRTLFDIPKMSFDMADLGIQGQDRLMIKLDYEAESFPVGNVERIFTFGVINEQTSTEFKA